MAQPSPESLDSRREFLRKAAILAAGGGLTAALAASIQRAYAIEAPPGSTYLDAEHVVILMQENRSFDHMFGALRGVRGFNDPRAVSLPNGNPVWLQTDGAGDTYGPFHLDLWKTNATWMGDLPHGRQDQGEARNDGKHDRWLIAKPVGDKAYAGVPLTLGYYSREDIPFYYGLADAFTVCDQAFCSVLGPTTPNRLHLWTGTVRPDKTQGSKAHVQNEDADFGAEVSWTTFPERLEELGISWKNYQNELGVPSGLVDDGDAWLSNFADNPLEFFTQYGVYFAAPHRRHLAEMEKGLVGELAVLDVAPSPLSPEQAKRREAARGELAKVRGDLERWSEENFLRLPAREQSLHMKAFVTNSARPEYRELSTLKYRDGGVDREMVVPKGDVLHQLREDVRTGKLPTVSWIIPPERFSDHPSNPWYGALYLSETLDILTQDPEVWKKTIFILCYDENDGYFDHIPPFVPPRSQEAGTGRVSAGIDTSSEHVREGGSAAGRDGPIGLGYRVPLVVASPWSRGGYVCSQVFDHTSVLRFLEGFLTNKTGRPIRETNISDWRRTICGDLTSVFRPPLEGKGPLPVPLRRDEYLAAINQAKYRPVPRDYQKVSAEEAVRSRSRPYPPVVPRQEAGVRPSCALPYELAVDGALSADGREFVIRFGAGAGLFGRRAAGAPYHVYAAAPVRPALAGSPGFEAGRTWSYAVSAGDSIEDRWPLANFEGGAYFLRAHGPNGFFREFRGSAHDPGLRVSLAPSASCGDHTGDGDLLLTNTDPLRPLTVIVDDMAYGGDQCVITLGPAGHASHRAVTTLPFARSHGWYDLQLRANEADGFSLRYAGRIETGREGLSDPQMAAAG